MITEGSFVYMFFPIAIIIWAVYTFFDENDPGRINSDAPIEFNDDIKREGPNPIIANAQFTDGEGNRADNPERDDSTGQDRGYSRSGNLGFDSAGFTAGGTGGIEEEISEVRFMGGAA